jgi:hypothetical protein
MPPRVDSRPEIPNLGELVRSQPEAPPVGVVQWQDAVLSPRKFAGSSPVADTIFVLHPSASDVHTAAPETRTRRTDMSIDYLKDAVAPPNQREQADARQVLNNAGGYAFVVDDWARLQRFLVLP